MTLYIKGHTFGYELQRMAQTLFPEKRVSVMTGEPDSETGVDYLYAAADGMHLEAALKLDGQTYCTQAKAQPKAQERTLAVLFCQLAQQAGIATPPWGVLTGIRPVKQFVSRMQAGMDIDGLRAHFVDDRLLHEDKFALALQIAQIQRPLLARCAPEDFSLYISIPFCPTRCSYCSFVSHSVTQAAALIPEYLDKLCEELALTAQIAKSLELRLRTVYFGGGTPTTLSAGQIARLTDTVATHFDLSGLWEYTIEAGRADTLTADKLHAIRAADATRISINPQTLSDQVLQAVRRSHTSEQVLDAFAQARALGFGNINMDLIAGLPTDTHEGFCASVDGLIALQPESITVHTLTKKRAADMTRAQIQAQRSAVGEMVDYAQQALSRAGFAPYYLYRQTGALAGLENVGYAKPGCEGLYNVFIMEECQTILAAGAGGTTKLCGADGRMERIFNYKYPYEYISRFDQVIERKKHIVSFFTNAAKSL